MPGPPAATIEVWGASPGYVVAPTNTATLSVTANDPELATLAYRWSVTSQPAGANAVLVNSNAAATAVNGMSVAGTYVFNVNVSHGVNTSAKQLYLAVYSANPQRSWANGFRIAAPYGLVFGNPSGTTHATIELPTTSATLQAGIWICKQRLHRARHVEHLEPARRSRRGFEQHDLHLRQPPRQCHQYDGPG